MKRLRITVNNLVYDVLVEVLEDDEQLASAAASSPTAAVPLPSQIAAPRQGGLPLGAPRMPAPLAHPAGAVDRDAVLAPLAGTVQKIFVQAGAHVEAKAPLVLLDAMKMDTYIYAARLGTVAELRVKVGDPVQVSDVLLRYEPGGR